MTNTNNINHTIQNIPIHVVISAIIILVVSTIGMVFYTTASIYQLYNPHFLDITNNQYTNLDIYVIVQSVSHIGLLISGIYILKFKKIGIYLYFIFTLALLVIELFFENDFILAHIVASLLLSIILTISYSKFR